MSLDELKPTLLSLIPDVTAPAMTLDEIVNTIRRRLTEGKTLAGYVDQTVARLKAMTNPDVTGLDEGLTLVEAKIKDADKVRAENADMNQTMSEIRAKVNVLLSNSGTGWRIHSVHRALDRLREEYDHVKERAVKAEALTVDVRQRLCKALHVLASTPLDQALDQTVRMVEARDYHAKHMLARLCPDVDLTGKTSDQVLSMIEAQHKTTAGRLGTSYAREMDLARELADAGIRLATAREERAQICRDLGLARGVSPERVLDRIKGLRDSLLGVVGHPGGQSLSLNAALSMLQSKVSGVALSLGLSEYASLVAIKTAVENLRKTGHLDVGADSNNREHLLKAHQALFDLNKILRRNLTLPEAISAAVGEISAMRSDRDNQARTIIDLTTNQDAQADAQYLIRTRLLTLLCEDPNRAKTMTTDEVVNLAQSKIAALALNLSLPETATLNEIVGKIQGMAPTVLCLHDLTEILGTGKDLTTNEALIMATNRIRGMRKGLLDLLNARS